MTERRSGIISIADVEAAAATGARSLAIPEGCVVTPSAWERAAELDVELAAGKAHAPDPARKALRAHVEELAQRAVARHGGDPELVEPITNAVMRRIAGPCPCGDH